MLDNKNDLIEGTLCYTLFENSVFDEALLEAFLADLKKYAGSSPPNGDDEVRQLCVWLMEGVDICFYAHHDKDDLFNLANYSADLENKWRNCWERAKKYYDLAAEAGLGLGLYSIV